MGRGMKDVWPESLEAGTPLAYRARNLGGWLRGRKRRLAKAQIRKDPWVRIPLLPPFVEIFRFFRVLAQLEERRFHTAEVVGSNPSDPTKPLAFSGKVHAIL
jgi:hypothetical protein